MSMPATAPDALWLLLLVAPLLDDVATAQDPADWAFTAPRRVALPTPHDRHWPRDDLDRFVLARLEAAGLAPAQEADRRTLLRRVSFDLCGLPPTPAELDAFLADPRPDAYERVVDRLLASPQSAERMARHWLDIARFGESNGFEHDELRPNAWRYRDWLVTAFHDDLPYDAFARAQLAGDVLGDAAAATGFLVAGAWDSVGQNQQSAAMRAVVRQDELEDMIGTLGQAFLGLTVHCARCHDHKFDPITQRDYYALAAALGGVHHGERDLRSPDELAAERARRDRARDEHAACERELAALEAPLRAAARAHARALVAAPQVEPGPALAWDFEHGLDDAIVGLPATAHGGARLVDGALELDGRTGWVASAPLPMGLTAKTLEAELELADLTQRGGAVIALQSLDGDRFDAIVFGEQEPAEWLAGSDRFSRTQSLRAPRETTAHVHVAIVWHADGAIEAFRDGRPLGTRYASGGVFATAPGAAQLLFGLRHAPFAEGKLLAARIHRAAVWARALHADEIAVLAAQREPELTDDALAAALAPDARARHAALRARRAALAGELVESPPVLGYAVVSRPPGPTFRLERGDAHRKAERIAPGGIAAVPGFDWSLDETADDAARRRRLAEALTSEANPLFARVLVNRLWQQHFQVGLVETPSDFGRNGKAPDARELLDYLALEFVAGGHRIKALQRRLVCSATYRQGPPGAIPETVRDAQARRFCGMPARRLDAESIRDAMLAVADRLDPQVGGPGYRDFEIRRFDSTYTYVARAEAPVPSDGEGRERRTLYRTWVRGGRNGFLDAFDCPDPSTSAPKRAVTSTPLQSLALLNDAFVLRMAEAFAARLRRDGGDALDAQLDHAFRLAFARGPTVEERGACAALVRDHGLFALARALLCTNEFLVID